MSCFKEISYVFFLFPLALSGFRLLVNFSRRSGTFLEWRGADPRLPGRNPLETTINNLNNLFLFSLNVIFILHVVIIFIILMK